MSKKIGLLLVLGIFGSAIFATGLMFWIFFRAINEPAKPAPKTGVILQLENKLPEYVFVDARLTVPAQLTADSVQLSETLTFVNATFYHTITTGWRTSARSF